MRGKEIFVKAVHIKIGITPACAGKRWFVLFRCAIVWDHPRVCGEKHASACTARAALRSPPRVRGKAAAARAGLVAVGITPACAGKRRLSSACTWQGGSPPRVRGKANSPFSRAITTWITPACAGKSPNWFYSRLSGRDHPRVCGEKWLWRSCFSAPCGSPPRVRGKDLGAGVDCCRSGITPACAGKRMIIVPVGETHRDHPRVCGEKLPRRQFSGRYEGSPPRVRGKEHKQEALMLSEGITPACAGKRRHPRRYLPTGRDHPRVCGEKNVEKLKTMWKVGSPPRVRGKEKFYLCNGPKHGITPACAGKSVPVRSRVAPAWDHPRVCGEKASIRSESRASQGSPPRVRGKETGSSLCRPRFGITPACAGKSIFVRLIPCISQDHPRVCGEKHLVLRCLPLTRGSPPRQRGKAELFQ